VNAEIIKNSKVVAYGRWLIKWRWLVILGSVALVMLAGYGAKNLKFESGYRIWFAPDNPQLMAFDRLENEYTKNDNILIGFVPADGNVFSTESAAALLDLTDRAWQIPHTIRVDAISNYQFSSAEEDDLWVRDLISDDVVASADELVLARGRALREPALKNRLIRDKADITGINVVLHFPDGNPEAVMESVNAARTLRDEFQLKYPGTGWFMTGIAMLNAAFAEAGEADMKSLTPLMYLVMIIVLFLSLRSVTGTLMTLIVLTFSMIVAMGVAGWFHVGLTPMSITAPTIIMTLAIADCVHILMTALGEIGRGSGKHEAIVESLRINLMPVTLTSVTTAIGFLSLNWIKVPPINHLGNITAVGVMAALFFAVVTLPALLSLLPLRSSRVGECHSLLCNTWAERVIKYRRVALWASLAVVALFTALIPRNELNDRFTEYFGESIRFRTDNDYISDHLTSAYQIEYTLPADGSGGVAEPAYLAKVEEFADWFESRPSVSHVTGIPDVLKRLNMNMHGDDSAYYKIPESRELAAQYLLLYEMSLPYGLDLNNQINIDKAATRFTVTLEGNASAREIRELSEAGEEWLVQNAPVYMQMSGSSPAVMFAYISEVALINGLIGTIVALILISAIIMVALKSVKIGLLSLIPNLAPIAVGFGIWALVSGQISMGMAPVIGMTMGIVVDDTIHFLSKYLRARRENGLNAEDAVRYGFKAVGPAMITTTITLAAGFSILAFSSFKLNSDMALMTTITIVVALIADFTLLPAILLTVDGEKQTDVTSSHAGAGGALLEGSTAQS